jgi:hypothetical protein
LRELAPNELAGKNLSYEWKSSLPVTMHYNIASRVEQAGSLKEAWSIPSRIFEITRHD